HEGARAGLAVADLSTGEFATTEINADDPSSAAAALNRELLRLAPAEVVVPAADEGDDDGYADLLPDGLYVSRLGRPAWRVETATEELERHFAVETLDAFGCGGKPFAIRAA